MRRLLLLIALNVGVIQSLAGMAEAPVNQSDRRSMMDSCDFDTLLIGPADNDTLYLYLCEKEEEELAADSVAWQQEIEPMLNQTWKTCNKDQVEAPFVYAAKKGLKTFISYVISRSDILPDQHVLDEALHGAVLYDHSDIAVLLLGHGAQPNHFMRKGRGLATFDVAFTSFFGKTNDKKPDPKLVAQLIEAGAYSQRSPFESAKKKWISLIVSYPEILLLYVKMKLFKTKNLSLKQESILYMVINELPLTDQIPIDLLQELTKARQLYQADPLLNLDNHNRDIV